MPVRLELISINLLIRNILVITIASGDEFYRGESEDDALLLSDEQCKTSNWSEWSECTATCGIGFMTRTRKFLKHSSMKKCKHVSVYETKKCMEPPCKKTVVEKVGVGLRIFNLN